jgi:hypothetical protein
MTIQEDKVRRSIDIHWPEDVVPDDCPLFAHNAIVIASPAATIWNHLINPTEWPAWYTNADNVVVDAPDSVLADGVVFDWTTFGANIHSTVNEFEPYERIGWWGTTDEWRAYHTWLLQPLDNRNTYVVMEETGEGANPAKLAESNPGHMHRGHALWNASLKFLCET